MSPRINPIQVKSRSTLHHGSLGPSLKQNKRNLKQPNRVLCSRIELPPFLIQHWVKVPTIDGARKIFAKFKPLKQLFRCFSANFLTIYSRLNTNSPALSIYFCLCHICITTASCHLSSSFLQHLSLKFYLLKW